MAAGALHGWIDRFERNGADAESRSVKERPGATYSPDQGARRQGAA
jgi:hypothetical protein